MSDLVARPALMPFGTGLVIEFVAVEWWFVMNTEFMIPAGLLMIAGIVIMLGIDWYRCRQFRKRK